MAFKSHLPEALQAYVLATWLNEPDILRRLREETAALPNAGYQIPPDQGQLMALLVKLIGAKKCLEIGVYTGYSSLAVALALPDDGRLVACDVNAEFTAVARRYWAEAGVAHKIDLQLRPALETLDDLLARGEEATFDFAFIDADKSNFLRYYERTLSLLRSNGLMLIDNVFWHGDILNPEDQRTDTLVLRELNATLPKDERVDVAILPIGDGVTIVRRR